MVRPLRLEFAGALYHVTVRGDRREAIFLNDDGRESFLDLLGLVWVRGAGPLFWNPRDGWRVGVRGSHFGPHFEEKGKT